MFEDSSNEADFSFQGKVNHVISREGLIGKFPEGFFKFWVNFSFSSQVPVSRGFLQILGKFLFLESSSLFGSKKNLPSKT